jgi:hypothetical protein
MMALGGAAVRSAPAAAGTQDGVEDYSDWSWVRAQFDLKPGLLHFSQFYFVSHPRPVRQAIERYRQLIDSEPFITRTFAGFHFVTSPPTLRQSG